MLWWVCARVWGGGWGSSGQYRRAGRRAGLHHSPAGYLGAVRRACSSLAGGPEAAAGVPTCGLRAATCGALSCLTGTCRPGKLTAESVSASAGPWVADCAVAATCPSLCDQLQQSESCLEVVQRVAARCVCCAPPAQTWRTSQEETRSVCLPCLGGLTLNVLTVWDLGRAQTTWITLVSWLGFCSCSLWA